jgi:GNAT superfamily N-acetyltransferase
MSAPISVRLDDEVKATLEQEAKARGLGVGTFLRQLAEDAAARLRRERIRAESEAVGHYVASNGDASRLVDGLGLPPVEGL